MSDTIHLACVDCRKELWVGQGGYEAPAKGYLYGTPEARENFRQFYDAHLGHDMRLVNMDGLDKLDLLDDGCDVTRHHAPGTA